MIGIRTRHSLAQFLELQAIDYSAVLFSKHGAQASIYPARHLMGLLDALGAMADETLMRILAEIVATKGDLRTRVNPKYRYDEREHDLFQCLLLDGYAVQHKTLIQTDPTIGGAAPVEDDLITSLQASQAPSRQQIIDKINDSAAAFRRQPPDYNAALVNARVAMETLAGDVAESVASRMNPAPTFNRKKWGEVVTFLRVHGEISVEQEKGLAGVFGFLSPGAHRPVGIPEDQMTRLGRSFALNICWFLLKNRLATLSSSNP